MFQYWTESVPFKPFVRVWLPFTEYPLSALLWYSVVVIQKHVWVKPFVFSRVSPDTVPSVLWYSVVVVLKLVPTKPFVWLPFTEYPPTLKFLIALVQCGCGTETVPAKHLFSIQTFSQFNWKLEYPFNRKKSIKNLSFLRQRQF